MFGQEYCSCTARYWTGVEYRDRERDTERGQEERFRWGGGGGGERGRKIKRERETDSDSDTDIFRIGQQPISMGEQETHGPQNMHSVTSSAKSAMG